MVASARPMPDSSIAMPVNLKGSDQSLTALIVLKSVSGPPHLGGLPILSACPTFGGNSRG